MLCIIIHYSIVHKIVAVIAVYTNTIDYYDCTYYCTVEHTNSTKVLHTNSTKVLHMNSTKVLQTNSTKVLQTNTTKVVHMNSTKVLHMNTTEVVQYSTCVFGAPHSRLNSRKYQ